MSEKNTKIAHVIPEVSCEKHENVIIISRSFDCGCLGCYVEGIKKEAYDEGYKEGYLQGALDEADGYW